MADGEQRVKRFVIFSTLPLGGNTTNLSIHILLDFLVTVKAAPHECVIRTGQP